MKTLLLSIMSVCVLSCTTPQQQALKKFDKPKHQHQLKKNKNMSKNNAKQNYQAVKEWLEFYKIKPKPKKVPTNTYDYNEK